MGSGGIAAIAWSVVVLGLLWLGVAIGLSIIAARRFRVAEQVLEVARSSAALLELAPSRPLLVRPDDRIEVDAQLLRELGLGSSVARLSDLVGNDSGLAPEDLNALTEEIDAARLSAGRVSRKVRANGSPRVFEVRGGPAAAT